MRYRFFLTLPLLLAMSSLLAKPIVAFSEEDEKNLRSNLDANKFGAVQALAELKCEKLRDESIEKGKTVTERARSAELALECITQATAVVTAMVAGSDKAFQVRELLKPLVKTYETNQLRAQSEEQFLGLTWGVGLGYSASRSDAVSEAEIVGGLVRVKSDLKQQPRVLFEFHKYFWCNERNTNGTKGCGPFVAVAATQDKVLSGVGMGFMYGRKTSPTDSDGFSVGLGLILDAKVKDLADGFRANEAPPNGETAIRYKEKARWSTLLFMTRTF